MTNKTLALVSCCKTKTAEAVAAKDLYISDLFVKTRSYAEREYSEWAILSALHGLIQPDTITAPYEYTLIGKSSADKKRWADAVFSAIQAKHETDTRISIFAGRDYRKFLQPLLENAGYTVDVPLAGLGIGEQKAQLKEWLTA